MSQPTALLVVAHPRADSLTASTADRVRRKLKDDGYGIDLLDLHAEGFDPRMTTADEPDWDDRDKRYSAEVHAHMRRVAAADVIVVVFPVWWFGPPAILKGWIDRVWNYGLAYGRSQSPLADKRMLWLGLTGGSREYFASEGYDRAIDTQLRVGVSRYCGITRSALRLVYDTVPDEVADPDGHYSELLDTAEALFVKFLEAA
ncbi:MAG: NAD(P)H oxidoreductase [Stackebrandtia sp.]